MVNSQKGLSIIEIIISIAILAIIASSSVVAIISSFNSNRLAKEESIASELLNQGLSALTSIADQNWFSISAGTYGLSQSGSVWQLTATPDITDAKFTRTITITAVSRDSNNNIVSSGGTIDPETYKAVINISWQFAPTRNNSIEMSTLLSSWKISNGGGNIATPTPTPATNSCAFVCQNLGLATGVCRQNVQTCSNNNENYQPSGDIYCTGGPSADTCCCVPMP